MQQSNTYIIVFTAIMTVIVGGLLSMASQILGPAQKKSIELDTKSSILNAVMTLEQGDDVLAIYDKRIQSLVVDIDGKEITTNAKGGEMVAEEVSILKNYKKDPSERAYPVFKFINEQDPNKVDAYILPLYGNGLWDKIWGYIALDEKCETIVGISLDHKQETPGLGARIRDKQIQDRYKGKSIYNEAGELVSVEMIKGEKGEPLDANHVDGMSGATLTGKGVNTMLKSYLTSYKAYFDKVNSGEAQASL